MFDLCYTDAFSAQYSLQTTSAYEGTSTIHRSGKTSREERPKADDLFTIYV